MQSHATIGAETIRSARRRSSDSRFLAMAEEIAQFHHEWVDGTGYPRGVRGIGIPLSARIAALADVYDALTSRRVYKDPMPHTRAKSIILDLSGRQFDPLVTEMFLASEDAFERLAAELRDPVDENGNAAVVEDRPGRSGVGAFDDEPVAITPRDRPATGVI